MGGQDSFLDLVSNIVGILLILLMIAGVRAQNDSPVTGTETAESIEISESTIQYADQDMLTDIESHFASFQEKETITLQYRAEAEQLQQQTEILDEHLQLQAMQYAELFDMMTSMRAAIDIVAEDKDKETKEKFEYLRQIQEIDAKRDRMNRTKQWLNSNRPQATVIENIPTPISKTVQHREREAHFRLLGGRIVYVPFHELETKLYLETAQNKDRFFKQKMSEGKIGPVEQFYLEYILVMFDNVTMSDSYGTGIGKRLEVEHVELTPIHEPIGEPLKEALLSSNSELKQRLNICRSDVYTITVWVYPDSFNEFIEFKNYLHGQGYRVAARPMEFGVPISGSPRGSKSNAQ
jgi:hypothetical protein